MRYLILMITNYLSYYVDSKIGNISGKDQHLSSEASEAEYYIKAFMKTRRNDKKSIMIVVICCMIFFLIIIL